MGIASDILLAWNTIRDGVTHKTSRERTKYWKHWINFCRDINIDPTLQTTSKLSTIIATTAFGTRVRSGAYGLGQQVKAGTVSTALSAITKTLELAGARSPLLEEASQHYITPIKRLLEGFRRTDPPSTPQLAVPVAVPHQAYAAITSASSIKSIVTADLILVAFYFLLRVGEYTQPRYVKRGNTVHRATRTVQFTVGCVGFFKDNKILPRTAPLDILLQADSATLRITNQKNGRMGTCIHHHCSHKSTSPVKALARIVHRIFTMGGSDDTLLCAYVDPSTHGWSNVTSQDIIQAVRASVKDLNLHEQGIDPDLVAAHSLRAGGAMALKLHGYDDTTIMKMGRWTSLTFLMYIHTQIAHLSKDIASDMSEDLPFLNIACIDIRVDPTTSSTTTATPTFSPTTTL